MPRIDDITSADGTRLAAYRWEPSATATGQVVLCHGLGEHMGRYDHVAAGLNAAGWCVTAVDFRGHGNSDGKRGHIEDWRDYVADLRAAADLVDGAYALAAHSMGALVALDYLRDAKDVTAAALSAPPLGAAVPIPAWKLYGARFLNKVVPRLAMDNEIPSDWICTDKNVVKAYDADPLVFGTVTPRWFVNFQRAIARASAHAPRYSLPMYVFFGSAEKIVDVSKLKDFAERAGATSREWDGLMHETMNEPVQDQVIAELVDWLKPHLAAKTEAA